MVDLKFSNFFCLPHIINLNEVYLLDSSQILFYEAQTLIFLKLFY